MAQRCKGTTAQRDYTAALILKAITQRKSGEDTEGHRDKDFKNIFSIDTLCNLY